MPTYEYECLACQSKFDVFQKITDQPLTNCPQCNKGQVRKLISNGCGLIFKGSGFYSTDYKKSSSSVNPSEKKREEKKEEKKEEKSECKKSCPMSGQCQEK